MPATLRGTLSTSPTIFWFRRDLRLADHPALVEAARRGDGRVLALFVVDDALVAPAGATRAAYLRATLEALDASIGGALVVRAGEPAAVLSAVAGEVGARRVVAGEDFAPYGRARDASVARALRESGVDVEYLDGPYVVAPGTLTSKSGTPWRVFGAFRRAWEMAPRPAPLAPPEGVTWVERRSEGLEALTRRAGRRRPALFDGLPAEPAPAPPPAGEAAARTRLEDFATRVESYGVARNLPGAEGTSRLSPHLRVGTLHPRQVLAATSGPGEGARAFASELAWREFYADVLFHHPASARHDLTASLAHLRVDRDARARARFRAWALGETGYPLVDAGMRQLLEEGWMHNRVRMVCASFLVKHLHLDWRWGARWFLWRLVDGDLASNQHGWQWTAGTGTDAAPYHRVFNPTLQAERFDAEGAYVRRYVPALAALPAPQCLQPGGGAGLLAPSDYVAPLVDAAAERAEALARFAEARARAKVDA